MSTPSLKPFIWNCTISDGCLVSCRQLGIICRYCGFRIVVCKTNAVSLFSETNDVEEGFGGVQEMRDEKWSLVDNEDIRLFS